MNLARLIRRVLLLPDIDNAEREREVAAVKQDEALARFELKDATARLVGNIEREEALNELIAEMDRKVTGYLNGHG